MKVKQNMFLIGTVATALALSSCGAKKEEAAASGAAPAAASAPAAATPAADLVTVSPEYPKPMFIGTPVPTGEIANLEKPDPEAVKARLNFQVPKGAENNVAKGKKVTSSDEFPIIGSLDLITDGDADGSDGCYVELSPGVQWVQIDLEKEHDLSKILLWHFHKQTAVYFDTIIQVSNDAEFKTGVTTIYNNDHDNSSKMGEGKADLAYVETNHGRLIDGKGSKGRYVRFYSNGNTANEMNHYIEIAIYGAAK